MKIENAGRIPENVCCSLNGKSSIVKPFIVLTLVLWLGTVSILGYYGEFAGPPGSPPLPIFFGFAIPLAVFFRLTPGGAGSGLLSKALIFGLRP